MSSRRRRGDRELIRGRNFGKKGKRGKEEKRRNGGVGVKARDSYGKEGLWDVDSRKESTEGRR